MKKRLACLGLLMALAMPASAWRPAGWVFFNWPWVFDHASQDWYWFMAGNAQWAVRHASAEGWRQMPDSGLAQGWSWHTWPYAYKHGNGSWYNFAAARNQWCVNMRTGEWHVFGIPPAPETQMAIVPGGTNAGTDPDYGAYSLTVNPFYMDIYEVSYARWKRTRDWAVENGYSDLSVGAGKAINHPVQMVRWYDCIKWCNARSERAGLTPVYYTDAARTQVYRTGKIVPFVKESANGFRVPTATEWEYAARGGVVGRRFPWGMDTIQHTKANYFSSINYGYDTSATRGDHPIHGTGALPFTNPWDSFGPNKFGLQDMAGNVWEWVLDWHPTYVGTFRMMRGGSYSTPATACRIGYLGSEQPDTPLKDIGFRTLAYPK
jgi:formylglycine-generating enzyme required for sulfatase activity